MYPVVSIMKPHYTVELRNTIKYIYLINTYSKIQKAENVLAFSWYLTRTFAVKDFILCIRNV